MREKVKLVMTFELDVDVKNIVGDSDVQDFINNIKSGAILLDNVWIKTTGDSNAMVGQEHLDITDDLKGFIKKMS